MRKPSKQCSPHRIYWRAGTPGLRFLAAPQSMASFDVIWPCFTRLPVSQAVVINCGRVIDVIANSFDEASFSITESFFSFARSFFISAPAPIPSRWQYCNLWPCLTFSGKAGHTSSWTRHLYLVSIFVPRNSPISSTFPWILISFMCCSSVFLGSLTLLQHLSPCPFLMYFGRVGRILSCF